MFSRARTPSDYLPYLGHVSPGVVRLDNGDLLAMLHLDGVAWEMAEDDAINARHAALNDMLRNVADERLVLTSHVVRTMDDGSAYPETPCLSAFGHDLDVAYRSKLTAGRLYRNDLFLSLLWRKGRGAGDKLENAVASVMARLEDCRPVRLGLRGDDVQFSEIAEALALILTGRRQIVPLVAGHLGGAIYNFRGIVRKETIEIRAAGRSTWAAAFGMREYPASTVPGMLDGLLAAPYCFVLTQTFAFLPKNEATAVLVRKQNRMETAGDKASGQIAELSEAADELHSNRWVMGTHHVTLVVFADELEALRDIAPLAQRHLAGCGAVVVREDLALEAVYWAQMPGAMALRSRPGAVTSRNFAALVPLHNYPAGHATGHWGGPVALFRTSGGTPYRFHFHHGDLGNVFMAGQSGSGKTTLLGFLLAQAERFGATRVLFDKDRGAEIFVRASGGTYLTLPNGSRSGLAPLKALTSAPRDVEFLTRLVTGLVSPDKPLTPEMDKRLSLGLGALLSLPPQERGLGELRAFLGQRDADGIGARLDKWCAGGSLGWVLDNDSDEIALDAECIGFDMTAVLDDATVRGPIMAYLFHRVEALMDGRRVILAIDEFWKALLDPGFRDVVNDKLKTIRKLNGSVILATQSPADALRSPIAHSIIEQCPTQILMPNGRAGEGDYVDGLKLTAREFEAVRETLAGGRRFLVKHGSDSVACELDLTGLEAFVAVLSGRSKTNALMDRLREDAPDDWLGRFMHEWRAVAA